MTKSLFIFSFSCTGQRDDLLERFSGRATQLNDGQAFANLLDADAGLEEDVVRRVHPRDDVTLTSVDSGQGGNATLREHLDRSTWKEMIFLSQNVPWVTLKLST